MFLSRTFRHAVAAEAIRYGKSPDQVLVPVVWKDKKSSKNEQELTLHAHNSHLATLAYVFEEYAKFIAYGVRHEIETYEVWNR